MFAKARKSRLPPAPRATAVQPVPVTPIREVIDPRVEWRTERLAHIESLREELKSCETALIERAAPFETRLAALRSELKDLETQLAPLAAERISAMNRCDAAIAELRNELREDAAREVQALQRVVEITRGEVLGNITGLRHVVLGVAARHPQALIEAAGTSLFQAWYAAAEVAVADVDVGPALAAIRARLLDAGIKLLELE